MPSTAETGTRSAGWVTQPAASYALYGPVSKPSSFLYALKHDTVPAGTVYVILDLESWALTPHPEQVTPKVYLREFVAAADKHGYKAILAPSIDLTAGMTCGKASDPAWKCTSWPCGGATPWSSAVAVTKTSTPDGHCAHEESLERV